MIVLGGGYVCVELAQMFSRAGVKVTLVFRSRLLPEMEPEIGAALSDYLSSEGITVLGKLAYQSVRKTAEGDAALTVLRDGVSETIVAERLLVAAGRTPNVEDRSEEHTSELQSLMRIAYAVFGLKKKQQT